MVKKSSMGNNRPIGITIIASLEFVAFLSAIFMAILILTKGAVFISSNALFSSIPYIAGIAGGLLVFLALFIAVISLIPLFLGIGLWKGKNWARILSAILATIGFLFALAALLSGKYIPFLVGGIINGFIFWYVVFNKEVVSFFKG